jgi:hypothetical protein
MKQEHTLPMRGHIANGVANQLQVDLVTDPLQLNPDDPPGNPDHGVK